MSPHNRPILFKALGLPPIERAELVEKLLSSFDLPAGKKIDALWAREAESRLDGPERGKIKTIPARAVFQKINKRGR